uniref:SET domain-containing protein n=1 Tax=Gossypium raimondii TaxID=29730 RepID=A0A0D2QI59_GOSRA|nr:hypothetical protein B456_007G157100 [Gossypium raimondii]
MPPQRRLPVPRLSLFSLPFSALVLNAPILPRFLALGWGVRAGEPILSGTFVCEYVWEILGEQEANNRLTRYGRDGCNYMFNISSQINDMSRLIEGQA